MLHLDDASSHLSSDFPTFANDDPPPVGSEVNVSGGIGDVDNRRSASEIPHGVTQVSLVEDNKDDIRQTNYPKENVDNIHDVDLFTSESVSVIEEKIDMTDVEAVREEDATDFVLDYLRNVSVSQTMKQTPTSMSFSANGQFFFFYIRAFLFIPCP